MHSYRHYNGESIFAIDGLRCRCAKRVEQGTLHVTGKDYDDNNDEDEGDISSE